MIFATRTLMVTVAGQDHDVAIHIAAPTEGDGCWECRFDIGWPDGQQAGTARGFDGVQAVYSAMQRIAVHLYASSHHAAGSLRWGKPGTGYGFPMPVVGYDTLIGDDRTAQVPP